MECERHCGCGRERDDEEMKWKFVQYSDVEVLAASTEVWVGGFIVCVDGFPRDPVKIERVRDNVDSGERAISRDDQ